MMNRAAGFPAASDPKGGSNSVVECQLPKLDVAGSSPVSRSKIKLQTPKKPALLCNLGPILFRACLGWDFRQNTRGIKRQRTLAQ